MRIKLIDGPGVVTGGGYLRPSCPHGQETMGDLMRAVYADEILIGLIMMHTGSDIVDGIDCSGVFLWRFMIAHSCQGKGYGRQVLEKLITHLKAMGVPLLYTSCGHGEGSPGGFYRKLGFLPTGDHYDLEIELVLRVDDYPLDLNLPEA